MNNDYPLARAWLDRIPQLVKEIHRNEARIENLRSASTSTTTQVSDMPRASSPNNHRMEDLLARIMDLESEVDASKGKLEDMRTEMIMRLDEWLEPDQALVLNLRDIQLLSWDDICNEMDYSRSYIFGLRYQGLAALEAVLSQKM